MSEFGINEKGSGETVAIDKSSLVDFCQAIESFSKANESYILLLLLTYELNRDFRRN
jgi:hypothetical protein